ncbi:MAG: peptidyl-prolyl cis-trans isomerase [Deltaproteobacteria bacterium]|nr:peptidyl-prolyl cis-trans isomerase [Deltaproteobacteria bacterium]
MRRLLIFGMICAIAASACGEAPGRGEKGKVLAIVDGEAITEEMLQMEADGLPPYVRPMLDTPAGKARFLESVITRDLLLREALRRGIDRRPEVAIQLSTKRKSILLEGLLKDVSSRSPALSDESLRRIYDSSPEQFRTGPRVKVSHMLFRDKARAEEMIRRIEEGEPFEALMKETGAYEGEVAADLGDIERGHFAREFEEAAFKTAPGEVAGPVKTVYGYHLIKVYSKKPAGIRSFEDVKPQLLAEQQEMAQREAFETLVADLRKASTIRVLVEPGEGGKSAPPAPGK